MKRASLTFFVLLIIASSEAQDLRRADRTWNEVVALPENVYQAFLILPETNVGYIDILLHRQKPQNGKIIMMTDLRNNIVVFFFRGVPGSFAIPKEQPYKYREYILEIRWQDSQTGRWYFWWNRNKLDDTLLKRPGLYPLAYNAPF